MVTLNINELIPKMATIERRYTKKNIILDIHVKFPGCKLWCNLVFMFRLHGNIYIYISVSCFNPDTIFLNLQWIDVTPPPPNSTKTSFKDSKVVQVTSRFPTSFGQQHVQALQLPLVVHSFCWAIPGMFRRDFVHGARTASRSESTSEGWKNSVVPKELQEDPLHAFGVNLLYKLF